jgi:hypothetical protein
MRGATIRHMTLAVGLVLLLLTLRLQPAAAHSTNGSDATHYRTRLDGLAPPVAGLTATVDPRGEWIQVTNATGKTLTILGYAHEPYLRITPAGVEQNATSPTVTLNQSLFADISQALTRQAAPQWLPMSPGNQARWHDHRIHWMGAVRPPAVQAHSPHRAAHRHLDRAHDPRKPADRRDRHPELAPGQERTQPDPGRLHRRRRPTTAHRHRNLRAVPTPPARRQPRRGRRQVADPTASSNGSD